MDQSTWMSSKWYTLHQWDHWYKKWWPTSQRCFKLKMHQTQLDYYTWKHIRNFNRRIFNTQTFSCIEIYSLYDMYVYIIYNRGIHNVYYSMYITQACCNTHLLVLSCTCTLSVRRMHVYSMHCVFMLFPLLGIVEHNTLYMCTCAASLCDYVL